MQKKFPSLFQNMLQKVQFQFAAQRKAGCVSGSTLSDGNTVHMCSDGMSMEAGKEEVGRTRTPTGLRSLT